MRLGLLLALLALVAPASALANRFAVVVGTNSGDRSEGVLRYAERDATRMAQVLQRVGGFPPDQVLALTDVTGPEVRRALIGLNARIRASSGPTVLFVYYSGHADAEALHLRGTRLALAEVYDLVAGSAAQARILVIDACRSGALTRVKGGRPTRSFDVRLSPDPVQGTAVVTSSAAGEDAQESDELGASFFTHHLLSALLGAADRDLDGRVTLGEAFTYTAERTLAATAATAVGPQHPTYRFNLGGRHDLVLTQPGHADRRLGTLELVGPGAYLVARQGAVVAEVVSADPRRRVALESGRYRVLLREVDHLREAEVTVTAGAVASVAADRMRRIAYARVVRKGGTERRRALSAVVAGGAQGGLLGLNTSWRAQAGARLDLPALALELRLTGGSAATTNERHTIDTHQTGASLAGLRAFDLGPITLGLGLELGGSWLGQRFQDPARKPPALAGTPDRDVLALVLGALAQGDLSLGQRYFLRLEAGVVTYVLPTGNAGDGSRSAIVTWQALVGLGAFL